MQEHLNLLTRWDRANSARDAPSLGAALRTTASSWLISRLCCTRCLSPSPLSLGIVSQGSSLSTPGNFPLNNPRNALPYF